MRISTLCLTLLVARLATPVDSAQTPATTQGSGTLMQLTVDELPPDQVTTSGIIRTIYPAGATLQLATGSGPALHFVESGTLTVSPSDGAPPLVIRAGTAEVAATPAAAASGGEVLVAAGDGFLLAPGTMTELRNASADPATVLDLLAAPDAAFQASEVITKEILVRQEVTLPEPPLTVTLSRVTLEPGDRLAIPEAPAVTFYTAVERSQAFNLSGQGFNRLAVPLDAYVLVIVPDPAS
jgi:hypothetical protein